MTFKSENRGIPTLRKDQLEEPKRKRGQKRIDLARNFLSTKQNFLLKNNFFFAVLQYRGILKDIVSVSIMREQP